MHQTLTLSLALAKLLKKNWHCIAAAIEMLSSRNIGIGIENGTSKNIGIGIDYQILPLLMSATL